MGGKSWQENHSGDSELGEAASLGEWWVWRAFCHWSKSAHVCVLSHFCCVWPFVTPWTVAHQARLSLGILQARVGCHALLQGIFPIQGSNMGFYVSCIDRRVLPPIQLVLFWERSRCWVPFWGSELVLTALLVSMASDFYLPHSLVGNYQITFGSDLKLVRKRKRETAIERDTESDWDSVCMCVWCLTKAKTHGVGVNVITGI